MSAVKKVAQLVPHHQGCIDWTPEDDFFCWCKGYRHEVAEAVVAGIQAMNPSDLAEVIGGGVGVSGRAIGPWPKREVTRD